MLKALQNSMRIQKKYLPDIGEALARYQKTTIPSMDLKNLLQYQRWQWEWLKKSAWHRQKSRELKVAEKTLNPLRSWPS